MTPEEFVKLWQTAQSLDEVAAKMKRTVIDATARASYFRQRGVPLKKFTGKRKSDYSKLAALAEQLNGKPK